jgi:hypothetical protein
VAKAFVRGCIHQVVTLGVTVFKRSLGIEGDLVGPRIKSSANTG